MAKVITLSRTFPAYHPKAGQPTHFVEKVCNSLLMSMLPIYKDDTPVEFLKSLSTEFFHAKHHTIRSGKRWKDGDMASLRVWSGKPYNSPQITIAPDVKLRVKDIEIKDWNNILIDGKLIDAVQVEYLSQNDGLKYIELVQWFCTIPFSGQILIWSDKQLPY